MVGSAQSAARIKPFATIRPLRSFLFEASKRRFWPLGKPGNQPPPFRYLLAAPELAMASEIELKLEVPPDRLRALARAPWLTRMAQGPVTQKKLISVYFDSGNRALRDAGLSLRVRQTDGRHVQTVKGSPAGSYRRLEWEREIQGAMPDRSLARHTALKPFTGKRAWRRLRPVFETDVMRTSFPVKSGGSHIEVALDRGKVKSGKDALPICEVELELKNGRVADLSGLARRIAGHSQVELGVTSKAERGYGVADDTLADCVGAADMVLDKDMTAADGFRAIAFSCLHHFAANRTAVLAGDAEGIHQMRVGLRRLRAALSLFKALIDGPELDDVKTDLKWLSGELSAARDFDVFLRKTLKPMEKDAPAGLPALEENIEARREQGFARARRLVKSARFRHILLKTGLWLTGGDWAASDDEIRRDLRQRPLRDMARSILKERTAKVVKKLKRFDGMDDNQRHKLRIAVKKLRYAVGFFESLFNPGHRRKRFAARLKALQSALGRLNDIRVHRNFARKQVRRKRQLSPGAYALGVATGQEREAAKSCLDAAAKAGKKLRDAKPFWT
jgi:inorganic triphosphatase YgiF